jgi:hypothetical protein
MSEVRSDYHYLIDYGDGNGPVPVPAEAWLTEDGRPYRPQTWAEGVVVWVPDPPKDGDPIYCEGVVAGKFCGDTSRAGERCGHSRLAGWHFETRRTSELPQKLAEYLRAGFAKSERKWAEESSASEAPP